MDITERLRALYVEHGTNYVQEAADEIERLRGCISDARNSAYECAARECESMLTGHGNRKGGSDTGDAARRMCALRIRMLKTPEGQK